MTWNMIAVGFLSAGTLAFAQAQQGPSGGPTTQGGITGSQGGTTGTAGGITGAVPVPATAADDRNSATSPLFTTPAPRKQPRKSHRSHHSHAAGDNDTGSQTAASPSPR